MSSYLPGTALITGAGSGIGRSTAVTFAREGCGKLFLGDINEEGLEATKAEITSLCLATTVYCMKVDIADEASVQSFIDGCVQTFGRIDYALNIAGIVPQRQPILEVDIATYDHVIEVNEYGTWLCHRAEIRQMIKQIALPDHGKIRGSIVSVSSLSGLNASAGMSTYCASKHAIIGFAKTDAQDYGPHGVRVNVVAPGMIDTALFRTTTPQEAVPMLEAITPVRRLGAPSDIGYALAFLSSNKASFISGVVVPVDGGLGLQRGVI